MASATSEKRYAPTDDNTSRYSDRDQHDPARETSAASTSAVVRKGGVKNAWACLLLSEDAARRESLARSAEAGGWEPIACGSVGEAVRQSKRWVTKLAAVDLGSMSGVQKAAYMQFAGTLASRERLLVISDEPTDSNSELWARQAGAWVYLPNPDFHDGVVELFAEARAVAEDLGATACG